jgi:hypothetical protein
MSKKYVFSDKDYMSGDGMMTSVWGPPMWHVLHTISFNFPIKPTESQKKHYYKLSYRFSVSLSLSVLLSSSTLEKSILYLFFKNN